MIYLVDGKKLLSLEIDFHHLNPGVHGIKPELGCTDLEYHMQMTTVIFKNGDGKNKIK